MIYLITSLLMSCVVFVVFKQAALKNYNSDHITIVNYIVATGISAVVVISQNKLDIFSYLPHAELRQLMQQKTLGNTAATLLLVGVLSGIFFAVNLIQTKKSVAFNGASPTSFFKQTGFIGGLFIAIAFFGEHPSSLQWYGIVLILASLILMISDFKALQIRAPFLLILLLVSGAFVEAANKFFAQYAVAGFQMLFLSVAFFFSLVYSLISLVWMKGKQEKERLRKVEILYGIAFGLSNLLNNFCKLQSLTLLPASIVIPTISAGTLVLATLLGITVYKEQTNKRSLGAMVIATISIIILNI